MIKSLTQLVIALIIAMSMSGSAIAAAQNPKTTSYSKKATHKKAGYKKASYKKASYKKVVHARRNYVAPALLDSSGQLIVQSSSVIVQDEATGAVLFEKNGGAVLPIASITKVMTAMVVLDATPSLNEMLTVSEEDVDLLKGTRSRLRVGAQLTREEMLRLALMSSENRAASALSRHYPGGRYAFIEAMNAKAKMLGLSDTHFEDATGLTAANVSSARDLVKMVSAAHAYPLIREFSTTAEYEVMLNGRRQTFRNTNPLVRSRNSDWEIGLSKTGFINEAGKCLVMHAWFNNKPTIIVLLDSWGKLTRIGDANRIKRWLETAVARRHTTG